MFGDERFRNRLAQRRKALNRAHRVLTHDAGVADCISGQYCGEATLHGFLPKEEE
jgi:hypothetical protein